jgi:folate-dependent phosphoribosylglycinamide formyltransferase PurN
MSQEVECFNGESFELYRSRSSDAEHELIVKAVVMIIADEL